MLRKTLSGAFALTMAIALASGCAWFLERGGATYTNPVIDQDAPDPAVLRGRDGYWYVYTTQTPFDGKMLNFPTYRSKDMVSWELVGDAMPTKPKWARSTQNFWAPHVLDVDGRYYMYYSAEPDEKKGMAIAVATATSPAGPFVDAGAPIAKGPGFEHIDPMPFDDPASGKKLLYWGSGFKPIRVQELADDRLRLKPGSKPVAVLPPSKRPYENLVEGAYVIQRDGWYYMLYSGDNCCGENAHYATLAARSKSAFGPFEKLADAENRPDSAILAANATWNAPGHHGFFTDDAGQDWLIYHAIDRANPTIGGPKKDTASRRPLLIDRLIYENGWPRMEPDAPSRAPKPAPVLR